MSEAFFVIQGGRIKQKDMDIFEKYESDLVDRLVELSTARGLLDGMLLSTPEMGTDSLGIFR